MLSRVETEPTPPRAVSRPASWQALRVAALVTAAVVAFAGVVLLTYELALARVPRHRAALERLVRAQTGLDIRFDELGVRWGWYGPEAVFRRVELGEPGRSAVLLRAPELVVGFDVWQTLRSGQLEAARITLVAADVDLSRPVGSGEVLAGGRARGRSGVGDPGARRASAPGSSRDRDAADLVPVTEGVRLLEGWRGGRVDLEGGTLRLADPGGSANPLVLQIRRASLRRAELRAAPSGESSFEQTLSGKASPGRVVSEWSGYGLVLLPERLGRTARLVVRLDGDLERPAGLSGTVRFEGRRLVFSGWRELLGGGPGAIAGVERYLPRAGGGDVTLNADFAGGRVTKASGKVTAGGVEFAAPGEAGRTLFGLDRIRGEWRLAQHGAGWRLRADSLELGDAASHATPASLSLDAGRSAEWVRGSLEGAPVRAVAALARWFAPQLDLSGVELGGIARHVAFDWNATRPVGQRLRTDAQLADVSIAPSRGGFALSGLAGEIAGDEFNQTVALKTTVGRLELAPAGAPEHQLAGVRVDARVRFARAGSADGGEVSQGGGAHADSAGGRRGSSGAGDADGGGRAVGGSGAWSVTTEKFELQHEATRLRVEGSLLGDDSARAPEIDAHAELTGADVALLKRIAGGGMAQAFGATFVQLTAGRIERAQFDLRGPLAATWADSGFTGSLSLKDAVLSGGELWPDAREVEARIDWRGPRMYALIEKGQAGSFVLSATKADWDVRGERVTHISGHVSGAIEDAIAWMRSHPKLQQYAPRVQNIEMSGAASLDFNLTVPPDEEASTVAASATGSAAARGVTARVTAVLEGARLEAVAGMPAMDALRGTLVFDSGYLRRSTLVGTWLGGPVTLNVGERREHGAPVLSIQGHGVLNARHLARVATAGTVIDETMAPAGNAEWSGELAYMAGGDTRPAQWRVRADSSLVGIVSHLPEPLLKTAATAMPLHVEAHGTADEAQLRLSLGDRLRGVLALMQRGGATDGREGTAERARLGDRVNRAAGEPQAAGRNEARHDGASWQVERGNVQFGSGVAVLPVEPVVLVEGRLGRLDLPAYVAAWQQLREEPAAAPIRADLVAGEMLVAGRGYADVHVLAERTEAGADLQLVAPDISGTAYWPAVTDADHPAQFHFAKLNVPNGGAFAASAELIAALGPATELSVDDIVWEGNSLGSGSATIVSGGNAVDVTDLRLIDNTQEVSGTLHCQGTACRLKFNLESTNAAATLADFGFRPELTAAAATIDGDLEWRVGADQPALATLAGRLNLRLEDGMTRTTRDPDAEGTPFALLLVPALMSGLDQRGGGGLESAPRSRREATPEGVRPDAEALAAAESHGLHFSRLEGEFEINAGEATTSNLHLDGDAEILMRGRMGLVARDYDQQVWILRGEGRLPAAVRRLGPTPRVAAAWLSLRELFAGARGEEGSRAPLHLQGSWDDPIVVAAD